MILRHLKLRNFRKYRDAEFSFPEGLVGVIGPNGSGKSTIFEAVAWTLFGNRLSRTGGFGLVSTQAGSGAPCWAELGFEMGGRSFRVLRRLTAAGEFTWSQLFEEGTPLATGDAATRVALNRILGLHPAAFVKLVYARQGELGGLARDTLGYRRRFFENLLELDWLDRTRARIESDLDALKRVAGPERNPAGVLNEEAPARGLEASIQQVERIRGEWEALGRALEAAEAARARVATRQAEIAGLESKRQTLEPAIAERLRSLGKGGSPGDPCSQRSVLMELAEVRGREETAALEVARISKSLAALAGATPAACPVCGGPLSPHARERLEIRRRELARQIKTLQSAEEILARRLAAFERARLESEQRAARARDLERMQAEHAQVLERLAEARAALASAGSDPGAYERDRQRLRSVEEELRRAVTRKTELEVRLAEERKKREEARRLAESLRRVRTLRTLEELLGGFRGDVIDGFLPAFEQACSPLLAEATEGRYRRACLDREFVPRLEDGAKTYVLSRFSGGEQDVACVALRLGVLRLFGRAAPLEVAVLDEVFGSQDRLRRRALLRALGRLCPPFRQIFVITHAEDVQELLPSVLRAGGSPTASP